MKIQYSWNKIELSCIPCILNFVEKRAFEKFYHAHFDKVYRFVFFRVNRDRALAEDLVSEIFMKVLEHFAKYDETKSKTSWLMTIARNHLANYWRDHKPTESLTFDQDGEEVEDESVWIQGSLEQWHKQTASETVRQLLALLSDGERDIVTLHYILGYSYAEIAEQKGITEGSAKVVAHRALKKLKGHL